MNCRNPWTPQRRTRWWQKVALVGAALLVGLGANAQVQSTYTFSQAAGTYTPITGTQVLAPGSDDDNSSVTNIGFSFTYDGNVFTQFVANANGHIRLGSSNPTSGTSPIGTTSNTNAISIFGRDGLSAGGVFTETIGTAPDRICVIQFNQQQAQWNNAGTVFDAQIRLYEQTGNVEIVFGSSARTTSYTGQLGIRGGTAVAANYSNRTTTSNWAATTAGGSAFATMTLSSTVFPTSGQTYTWAAPVPPTCLVPTGVSVNNITTSSADVNFTCSTCDGNYIVEYGLAPFTTPGTAGTAGAGGTVVTGTGSPIELTGLATASNYVVYVREDCGAGDYSANTSAVSFTTSCDAFSIPFSENFNTATVPAVPTCWTVVNVNGSTTWNTVALNASGFTGNIARYSWNGSLPADDWLISPDLELTGGVSYRVRYKYAAASASFPEAMDVWWGDEATVGAMTNLIVDHGTFTFTTASQVEYDFVPPTTGTYNIGWHAKSAANQFDLRLDDIEVILSPSCFAPTGITLTGLSPTTADLSWTDANTPGSVGYEWEIRTSGAPGSGATGLVDSGSGTDAEASAEGLTANTNYTFYVRADCDEPELSGWSIGFPVFTGYCAAGATSTLFEKISNVTVADINNSSTGTAGYQNFTAVQGNVVPGETYVISVGLSEAYSSDQVLVWMDLNNNLVFEPSELLFASNLPLTAAPVIGSITIPSGQAAGSYRMRIRLHDSADGGNDTPCGNSTYGQVEDYTINVCGAPTAVATVTDEDCTDQTFEVTVAIANIGTGTTASLEYSYNGVPQTPIAYDDADIVLSNIPAGTTVTGTLFNNLGCSTDIGQIFSSCDIELDCDGDAIVQSHCYETNDTRTWTYVNSDPTGTVDLKFLSGTMDVNDQFRFWEGVVGISDASPASLNGLLAGQGVISVGNVLSVSIITDGTGSCEDGAFGGITWQVRCGGCTEPSGLVTIDENDLLFTPAEDEFPLINCVVAGVGTFNPWLFIFDSGIDENTSAPPATVGYRLIVNGVPQTDVTGIDPLEEFDPINLGTFALGTQLGVILLHEDQVGQSACNNTLVTNFTVPLSACPPSNDNCADAIPLNIVAAGTCPAGSITATTVGATQEGPNPSCAGGAVLDVWYSLDMTNFSAVQFLVQDGTASVVGLEIYNSCGVPQGVCVADVTTGLFNFNFPSDEYLLRFFTTAVGAGDFTVCFSGVQAPPGNTCATAIDLGTQVSPISGSTAIPGTTNAFNEACAPNTANDLVYFIDVPDTWTVTFTNTSPSYDSRIRVAYGPSCPGNEVLFCWDDPDDQTNAWTNQTGGTQRVYWIQDGFLSGAGTFTLAWTLFPPPVDCTTPAPGNTLASTTLACPGSTVNLSIQNVSNDNGLEYQWEVSTDGGATWVPSGPNTATWQATFNGPAQYRVVVTCTLSDESVASTPVSVDQDSAANCICTPTYTFGKTDGDLISNVVIVGTTLSNNTGTAQVNPAYTYFTGAPNLTGELQAGTSYTVQVTYGSFTSQHCAVWIDFNGDGVFSTPAERVGFTTSASSSAFQTVSFPISLPCNPAPGTYRMRVRNVWLTAGNLIDPCSEYGYGETEDYDVTILPPPACPTPVNLVVSGVTATGATATWAQGCTETEWLVEYGPVGFTPGNGTQVPDLIASTYAIGGLAPQTAYSVYVYADCGVDGLSAALGPVNFTTPALPPVNDDCAGAIALTVNPDFACGAVTAGTTISASTSAQSVSGATGTVNNDVWFTFVATNAAHRISLLNIVNNGTGTSTSIDMGMALYTGTSGDCAANALTFFGTSDPETWNVVGLTPGTTYYLRVYGWFSSIQNVTFNVCIGTQPPPPANDDCAGAVTLPVSTGFTCSAQTAGTLQSATNSGIAVSPCTGVVNDDVWYSFTATSTQHIITLSSVAPFTTMRMQLFSGACGSLVHLSCSTVDSYTTPNSLTIGQTYYLRVYSNGSTAVGTTFNICVTTPPVGPPANDECAGAFNVPVNAGQTCTAQTFGTVFGATASGNPVTPCFGTADDDVWFSFVAAGPTHTVSLNSVTGSVTSMNFNVFSGACGTLTNIGCGATGIAPSTAVTGLTAGTTYYVRVYTNTSVGGQNTTFNVCITSPPANDLCANAIAVTCNSVTAGSTVGSTLIGAPATCTTSLNTAGGVWYTVQGWGGPMVASLCGSGFDTKIGVFTGSCGALTCVIGNDDFCGTQSQVTWASVAGTTYYIYVTGFGAASGSFDLTVTCGTTAPTCVGANGLTLEFQTDATPAQTTWEVRNSAGTVVAVSGGPLVAPNGIQTQALCLPDGCYTLRVFDSAGDGITNGGYTLRQAGPVSLDTRIIDNFRNFSSGSLSAIGNGPNAFCFPMSTQKPIFVARDKMDWVEFEYLVSEPDNDVSAQWQVGDQTLSGYQFWFFDPNGSYSFRRNRNHATSDGFGPANEFRACHMKINNWALANRIPANVLMNVRIRARVAGTYKDFGPAYRFKIDPVRAACPLTKLNDIPDQQYLSCNQTRNWGPGNWVHARQVSGANRYQFRFRIPAEGFSRSIIANTYFLQLNWGTLPLQPGKTYNVDVRVSKDGGATWCTSGPQWGDNCTLTIGNGAQDDEQNLGLGNTTNGSLAMWPNPNRGDQLWIDLNGIEAGVETVAVDIFDLTGKQIVARIIPTQGDRLNTVLNLNGDLATGMYLVNITAGDKRYTERLVIAN